MKDKQTTSEAELLEQKANELVALLQKGAIDARGAKAVQQKINKAVNDAFKEIDAGQNKPDLLNDFETLFSQHNPDTNVAKQYPHYEWVKKTVVAIIGVVMITLGMAMIIMPAPPYFEMFTIFYFNPNDGVTLMDLIALLIVFTGIYLFLNALLKKHTE